MINVVREVHVSFINLNVQSIEALVKMHTICPSKMRVVFLLIQIEHKYDDHDT